MAQIDRQSLMTGLLHHAEDKLMEQWGLGDLNVHADPQRAQEENRLLFSSAGAGLRQGSFGPDDPATVRY